MVIFSAILSVALPACLKNEILKCNPCTEGGNI
jgi:hypothetical protein